MYVCTSTDLSRVLNTNWRKYLIEFNDCYFGWRMFEYIGYDFANNNKKRAATPITMRWWIEYITYMFSGNYESDSRWWRVRTEAYEEGTTDFGSVERCLQNGNHIKYFIGIWTAQSRNNGICVRCEIYGIHTLAFLYFSVANFIWFY